MLQLMHMVQYTKGEEVYNLYLPKMPNPRKQSFSDAFKIQRHYWGVCINEHQRHLKSSVWDVSKNLFYFVSEPLLRAILLRVLLQMIGIFLEQKQDLTGE